MKSWIESKRNKTILLLLIASLVTVGAAALFIKNQAGSKESPIVSLNSHVPSGRDKAEPAAPTRTRYPVGDWSIAIPYLNPFGSPSNYQSTEHTPNQFQELKYINERQMETFRMTAGELWQLNVQWKGDSGDPWEDLRLYINELGGRAYMGSAEDTLVVTADDAEGITWWGIASKGGDGYQLKVFKELRLRHGLPAEFKTSDYPGGEIYFMTNNENHKYQSLRADLNDGGVRLHARGFYSQGKNRRDLSYNQELNAFKSTHYTLNDIPQDPSAPLFWKVTWSPDSDPRELVLSVDETEDITPFRDGERLGSLKITGGMTGHLKVEAPPGVVMSHPELHLHGDRTPEGDTLFWLPPGYWNVTLEQESGPPVHTRLVPVSAGEMTVLDMKPLIRNAYRNDGIGKSDGAESGLQIEEAVEQGEQARITFMLLDSEQPGFAPNPSDIEILEGGRPGKLLELSRMKTPPSVVLALDSSGSMAKSMSQVLASARSFIEGLPKDVHVQVIDFDTQVRVIEGTSKKEALAGLSSVKAQGNTRLYDSFIEALGQLKDKTRPSLVLFTDGVDSNAEKAGTGSASSRSDVEQAARDAGVPVYAIGFGPDHDNATLLELATMSGGTYYSAQDATALDHVFGAINERLGNRFEVVYERPKEQAASDVPVIAMTLDVSGSMDADPASGNGAYRIDKVKHLFHDFIAELPERSLMQLLSFSSELRFDQGFTSRKAELLQALGNLKAVGGTDILNSVFATYQSLKSIPSEKRVIVYVTDAALAVDEEQKSFFETTLAAIKEEGIGVLWVGLGTEDSEEAFKWAAEKSGGHYVISEDPAVLTKAIQEALAQVQKRTQGQIPLTLAVKSGNTDGSARLYTDDKLVDFPMLRDAGNQVEFQTIGLETGFPVAQYGQAAASLVYGRDLPGEDVQIRKRISLNAQSKNKAVEWKASELYLLKKLKGVSAPQGRAFAAIEMELTGVHKGGAAYQIPDFASHFFMRINDSGSYPASTATWLTEQPLSPPGDGSITVKAGEAVKGLLVFLVPDEEMERASLHYYDTGYGHISLALIGELPKEDPEAWDSMPKSAIGKLSDTFQLSLQSVGESSRIGNVAITRDTSMFKLVETELQSLVNADLKLDPRQRFYWRAATADGPFLLPVHTATALLPHGLLRPATFAPGSANTAVLAFQTPNALDTMPSDLYVDLSGGATVLPISSGTTENPHAERKIDAGGKGVSLTVNALSRVQGLESGNGNYVVADVTLTDESDGFGSTGFRETFKLVPVQPPRDSDVPELAPDPLTDGLLLGMDADWSVFDGAERRGLLLFSLPHNGKDLKWSLQSDLFPGLNMEIGDDVYKEEGLLVVRIEPELEDTFDLQLSAALAEVLSRHRAREAAGQRDGKARTVDFNEKEGRREAVPAPMPAVHGLMAIESVRQWADLEQLMSSLRWLPSTDPHGVYRHSPEAVIAQGWGTEGDLAGLAGGLLSQLGYSPSLGMVQLTERGREALRELGSVDAAALKYLPAWTYQDEQGANKIFVVPFMKELSELGGLAFFPGGQEQRGMTSAQATISVYFQVEAKADSGLGAIAGDIGGALGGGDSDGGPDIQDIRVLQNSLDLDALGQEALDIRAGGASGNYTAVLENGTMQIVGNRMIDAEENKIVGVRIEVQLPQKKLIHETKLRDGEEITDVFHTVAVNLPDLSAEAAATLQKAADRAYSAVKKPDDHSALSWYTRNILYRFVANQTAYESELAEMLDVTAGRVGKERVIFVTVRNDGPGSTLKTSVDLQQSANRIHRGSEDASRAFHLMSGLFASRLEGAVLPGNGADLMDIWMESPEDTRLLLSLVNTRKEDLKRMEEQGYPETLIERARTSTAAMLIPNAPTVMNGERRWAWLEIDPATYETISVTDTGEHGSFAEFLISMEPVSPTGDDYLAFMAGSFIGVSTSVWSIGSFALMLDDYEDIIKAAKAYTYGLGEVLSGMMDNKDLPKLEYSISPIKLKLIDKEFDYLAKRFEEVKIGKKGGLGGDVVGFALGFKSGAAYYFKQAEAAIKKPVVKNGPPSGGGGGR
jgi:Mg-chelatase subunit ChlD